MAWACRHLLKKWSGDPPILRLPLPWSTSGSSSSQELSSKSKMRAWRTASLVFGPKAIVFGRHLNSFHFIPSHPVFWVFGGCLLAPRIALLMQIISVEPSRHGQLGFVFIFPSNNFWCLCQCLSVSRSPVVVI